MITATRTKYAPPSPLRRIFIVSGIILALLVGLYAYLMRSLVSEAIAWRSVEREIVEENTRVSGLEREYIALDGSMTREAALKRGLREPREVVYVTRRTDTRVSLQTTQ